MTSPTLINLFVTAAFIIIVIVIITYVVNRGRSAVRPGAYNKPSPLALPFATPMYGSQNMQPIYNYNPMASVGLMGENKGLYGLEKGKNYSLGEKGNNENLGIAEMVKEIEIEVEKEKGHGKGHGHRGHHTAGGRRR